MPLQLPNLDDRAYADLAAEARRLIPTYDPDWTNHNPSDPGVTLLELFAYLTEGLLYRLDRVTAQNQRKFLKLLDGVDRAPGADLTSDVRDTVLALRARERAVTAADFERLALEDFNRWLAGLRRAELAGEPIEEWWDLTQLDSAKEANLPSHTASIARASCAASRNLERDTEEERTAPAPAHVSLTILPQDALERQPTDALRTALWRYLDGRRMLTMRQHVVGPVNAPVGGEIIIACESDALISAVRERVVARLESFLHPLTGGPAQKGWPFGRDVYVSELYEQIEAVEGVDYVADLMLSSECASLETRCVAAPALWHDQGELIGLALAQHHLPVSRFAGAAVVIVPAASFLPVQLVVTLTAAATADPAALRRQAKAAVREFFHPLHNGPRPDASAETRLRLDLLQATLGGLAGVGAAALEVQVDPARLLTETGRLLLRVLAGELVNWQTRVAVQGA